MDAASEQSHAPPKYKKKKKKGLLQQAKKYGAKGLTGRGGELSKDNYDYLLRILELMNSNFATPEEKDMFVNNSLDHIMTGEEAIAFLTNQLGCRVIEKLLPDVSDELLMRLIEVFSKDLRPLVTDRFASHVLQKLIVIAGERGSHSNKDAELGQKYDEWVLKCSNFVMNNLEDFVWDQYANHVIRTCLECLGGFSEKATQTATPIVPNKGQKATLTNSIIKREVVNDFKDVILELARRLMLWPQFADLAFEDKPCGLLKTLLIVLGSTSKKSTGHMVKKLLKECFRQQTEVGEEEDVKEEKMGEGPSKIPDIFVNVTGSWLLEAAISVASPKHFTKIYSDLFRNNLGSLAQMSVANHSVQKLFQHCTDKTEFEAMYDEIAPFLENIIECRHTSVVVSLAEACQRLKTKEQYFVRETMKIFHCLEPMERQLQLAPLVLKLTTFEQKQDDSDIQLHGSLILQTILKFSKPIKVIDSLLAMKEEELLTLFSNQKGSHVMDAFMSSPSVGAKSHEKMFKKLKGNYFKLSSSKFGSRSFDGMWPRLNIGQKISLMEELAPKVAIMDGLQFGSIISSKYDISLFRYQREKWMEIQQGTNNKRKLFEDIIGDLGKKKERRLASETCIVHNSVS